ncbi:MAG TPA: hypothetical protein VGU20_10855 [Stellaceae bacterium]|nr:hypothetical protein [Stellaceae bacterium]
MRTEYMAKYAKVRLAAKLMIAKYGKAAASIARLRARRSARQQDEAAVEAWASIARAADAALSRSREKRGVSVSAVLGGPLRRQQFTPDDLKRDD